MVSTLPLNHVGVSHVIPSLNQGRFLRRCIDSCLVQCDGTNEIVVVDGGSSDETTDILNSYGERLHWSSMPDAGQGDAVNEGIRRAKGEIIAWINADDFYPTPGIIDRVVAVFASSRQVDIVYGDGMKVDVNGRRIRPHLARRIRRPADILVAPSSFVMQPAVFFKRKLFTECGGLRTTLHWAPDYDLWLRLFPRAREVRYISGWLACTRFHAGAKSVYGITNQFQEIRAIKRHYAKSFELGPIERLRLYSGVISLYIFIVAARLGLRPLTCAP